MDHKTSRGIIGAITKFQLSGAYPVVFALLCAISGVCGKLVYIPILIFLACSIIFSSIFVKDNKVFIPPIFMMYYALGTDNKQTYNETNGDVFASIDTDAWIAIICIAVVIAATLIIRFSKDGTFKSGIRLRGKAFWGVIAIDAVLLTNGLFSPTWKPENLLFGAMIAFSLTACYLILCPIIKKGGEDIFKYTAKAMVLVSFIVLAQMLFCLVQAFFSDSLIYYHEITERWVFNRNLFCMSWGITTVAGGVLVLGIPSALYLARDEKYPAIYTSLALLFAATPILMNTRSSMVVGALCLIVGAIIISLSGKNRRFNLLFFSTLLSAAILAIVAACVYLSCVGTLSYYLKELWLLFRFDAVYDRLDLILVGLRHFSMAPLFGIGILVGAPAGGIASNNVFANMYHNVIVQFLSSMGCVGVLAFILHIKDFVVFSIERTNIRRVFLLMTPAAIILLSMVDNFFFYPNFQIFYMAFWVLAEKDLDLSKSITQQKTA